MRHSSTLRLRSQALSDRTLLTRDAYYIPTFRNTASTTTDSSQATREYGSQATVLKPVATTRVSTVGNQASRSNLVYKRSSTRDQDPDDLLRPATIGSSVPSLESYFATDRLMVAAGLTCSAISRTSIRQALCPPTHKISNSVLSATSTLFLQ